MYVSSLNMLMCCILQTKYHETYSVETGKTILVFLLLKINIFSYSVEAGLRSRLSMGVGTRPTTFGLTHFMAVLFHFTSLLSTGWTNGRIRDLYTLTRKVTNTPDLARRRLHVIYITPSRFISIKIKSQLRVDKIKRHFTFRLLLSP